MHVQYIECLIFRIMCPYLNVSKSTCSLVLGCLISSIEACAPMDSHVKKLNDYLLVSISNCNYISKVIDITENDADLQNIKCNVLRWSFFDKNTKCQFVGLYVKNYFALSLFWGVPLIKELIMICGPNNWAQK